MDVPGALIIEFFANTRECNYQDTEGKFAGREDVPSESDGRETDSGISRPDRQTSLRLSRRGYGRFDRTAWGSYTESAPPILPANTCVPGFEDELLLTVRRVQHRQLNSDNPEEDDNEAEQSNSSDDDDSDDRSKQEQKLSYSDALAAQPTRRARDAHRRSASSGICSSLPTTLTQYGNLASLFGSTIRPATTTLRRVPQDNERARSSNLTLNMASKTHTWISLWFLLTAPVIFWDAAYCFMRPRSFEGGDLHWIWKPYEIYQEVDYVYGVEAYQRGDGFTNAQSFLNVIETFLNLYYLYAQHLLASPAAPLVGFAAAVMTLSKTVLYWAQEYYCGGCAIGHNDLWTLFWFWIVPNGLWIIVPSFIIARLSRDISAGLTTASKVDAAKKD